MFVNPGSAFVENPSVVASSSVSAKKARYARLFPSTRKSSASRAGPSSRCSSAPVSVFGIRGQRYRPAPMRDVEIRPFSDDHLGAAARLLADRHERHLAAEPLLARRVDCGGQIAGEVTEAEGVVALVDDDVRAYLVGRVRDEDAVVRFAGCAAAEP